MQHTLPISRCFRQLKSKFTISLSWTLSNQAARHLATSLLSVSASTESQPLLNNHSRDHRIRISTLVLIELSIMPTLTRHRWFCRLLLINRILLGELLRNSKTARARPSLWTCSHKGEGVQIIHRLISQWTLQSFISKKRLPLLKRLTTLEARQGFRELVWVRRQIII